MAQVKPKTEYFAYEKNVLLTRSINQFRIYESYIFFNQLHEKAIAKKQTRFAKKNLIGQKSVKIRNYSFGIMVVGSGYHDKN